LFVHTNLCRFSAENLERHQAVDRTISNLSAHTHRGIGRTADDHRRRRHGAHDAYQAAPLAESVTVLDRSRVGDPATASFGLTRSVRNDYRDPDYARLALEARRLWREFERECGRRLLVTAAA
jgi:hypothetical protein